jgi:hypothetical protein
MRLGRLYRIDLAARAREHSNRLSTARVVVSGFAFRRVLPPLAGL